jgi:hypothetical protein
MLKPYLPFIAIALCVGRCLSQSIIKRVVIDDQNTPIYNAHVYFTGIPIGVITNEDGYFELKSDESFISFEVSFVGMKTVKIAIAQKKKFTKLYFRKNYIK